MTIETVGMPNVVNLQPLRTTYSAYGNILAANERAQESRNVVTLIRELAEQRVLDGIFNEIDVSKFPAELKDINPKYLKAAIGVQVEHILAAEKAKTAAVPEPSQ